MRLKTEVGLQPKRQIAVVGYGVAGIAIAGLLRRAGHQVVCFEQGDGSDVAGAGLLLQPLGLAVLQRMGLLRDALALGARITRIRGETCAGRPLMDLEYAHWKPASHGLGIQRQALSGLLRSADPQSSDLLRARILGVDAAAGVLTAHDGERYGPFDLIVVADGAGSALRSELPLGARQRRYRWGAWLCLLDDPGHDFDGELIQRFSCTRQLALWPVGALSVGATRRVNLSWRVASITQGDPRAHDVAAWKRELSALYPRIAPLLEQIEDMRGVISASYREVTLKSCVHRRVALLGDAAHAMSPQLGQGATLALMDAWQLAAALHRSVDLPTALVDFERSRREHVATYRHLSNWLTPLFQSDHRALASLRDRSLPVLGQVPWVRSAMLRALSGTQLGWFGEHPGVAEI